MFAISQTTTMLSSAARDLEEYPRAGVEAIELVASKFPASESERREMVREWRANGIVVSSAQTAIHSIFPNRAASRPEATDARLERFCTELHAWAQLLEVPELPFVVSAGVVPHVNLREGWKRAAEWLHRAGEEAARAGVRIAFEPMGPESMHLDTFVYGLEQGRHLIHAGDHPNLTLAVDAWHLWADHDLAARLREAAPEVSVVHVSDRPAGGLRALDDRVLPGEGVIPLAERILEPLRGGGFGGPFTAEIRSDPALPDSLWKLPPEELLARTELAMRTLS